MNPSDDPQPPQQADDNPMQAYFDWQLTTLMLAYDLAEPIPQGDEQRAEQRREAIREELSTMVRRILPPEYLEEPTRDFPPEVMMSITRETIRRAAEIAQAEPGGAG